MKTYTLTMALYADNEEGYEEYESTFEAVNDAEAEQLALMNNVARFENCMGATLLDSNDNGVAEWIDIP